MNTEGPLVIGVVICTRNRAESLAGALDSYRTLWADPAWTMVVVDDGSTDGTAEVIAALGAAQPGRVTSRRTAGVGLGAARNVGWRASDEPVVLFTDDDCHPAPDLFAELRRYLRHSGHDFVGGRLTPFEPADAAVAVVTRTEPLVLDHPQFVPAGLLPGANLAVRRAALEAVGGFDPAFGAGTPFPAEDVDLVARLLAHGCRGGYHPALVIRHRHGRHDVEAQRALRRDYDIGRGAYFAKCLSDPRLRSAYLRGWARKAWRGSWRSTTRELVGAWRYWTRPRALS